MENPFNKFKVKLDYEFALPNNHGYGAGSTYTIEILDVFSVLANPESTPLKNESGIEFATFIVTNDNKIVITFNDEIEENSNVSGFLELESEFDAHYKEEAETEINFPIEGKGTLTYPIKFIPKGTSISKKGVPNKAYNTETIEWTVDFNKDLQEIKNATLNDIATEGDHSVVDSSFKVYKLHMNADGSIDESKTESLGDNHFGSKFPLKLGDIDSADRIVYETEINDNEGTSYKNEATLNGDNVDPVTANATVKVSRGKPLEKRSRHYDPITQTITWEVKFNYDEKDVSKADAKLTDILGDNQKLINGSFKVQEIDIDPDTGAESGPRDFTNFMVNTVNGGFELQFNEDISKAYKITYQTEAIDRVDKDGNVSNTIHDKFGNKGTGNRSISQGIFIKTHENSKTNYNDKVTGWKLRLNTDEYEMKDVVIIDTLPKGFTLDENSLEITHGGQKATDYDITTSTKDGKQEFTIKFKDDVTKEVIVRFLTDIDFDNTEDPKGNFTNNALLEWEDSNGISHDKKGSATFTPDGYTKANGFKGSSYNAETKEITWEIGLNYNNVTLNNATVEDFILGNQNFDINSVEVYHMTLTGGSDGVEVGDPLTKGNTNNPNEYEIEEIANNDGDKGFRVKLGNISTPYKIVYKTDLNNQLIDKTYNNTATVNSDNHGSFELKASVSPYHGGEYTKKSAKQNDENPRIVNWRVNINYAQSTVDNVSISDTPSENQIILPETIKLYDTVVTSNSINKGKELEKDVDYTLKIVENADNTETLTIKFTEETIDRAYVLEYDTRIMYKDDGYIENDVKFNGEQTEGVDTDNSVRQLIELSNIGGGIDGKVGSLEVTKVDAADQKPLAGATFELYDENDKLVTSKTTDADGKVLFTKLLYREYTLKEVNAPEGYVIQITDGKTVEVNAEVSKVTIENKKFIGDVVLTKIDAETKEALEGVVFDLKDENGVSLQRGLTTGEDGKLKVDGLEPGDYFFKEVEALHGYNPLSREIPFTIKKDQTEVLQLEPVGNDIILGSVELTKVDGDNGEAPLEGVKFKLVDDDKKVVEENLTTNSDGKITVDKLRPGTYYFIETEALEHYVLDEEPIKVVIEKEQTEIATVQTKNELIAGSVELTKKGEDGKFLEGVKFELQDENGQKISEHKTNENGKIVVENLKPGFYQFKEIESIPGYELNPAAIERFEIIKSQDKAVTVEFTNDLTPGSVELIKLGEENETLKDAVFKLIDDEGTSIYENLTTDENGRIIVKDLKPGTYYFVETKAPFGHELDESPVEFEIEFNQQETLVVPIENERSTSGVELTKKGEYGDLLEGVVFELQDQYGNPLQEGLTTNENGVLIIDDLKPGHYQLIETETIHGYMLFESNIKFEIELGQTERTVVEVINELQTGSVELTKIDDETGEVLAGAIFDLQDRDGNLLHEGLMTDENGIIFVGDLKPDDYQFVESEAPEGYDIDTEPITFTIDKGQRETLKISTDNSIIKGDFVLTKVDYDNQSMLLEGVEFELQDQDGNKLHEGLVTDEDGKIYITELRPGTYILLETNALFGYEVHEPIEFTIGKGQIEPKQITMTNKQTRSSVQLTKYDKNGNILQGAVFELQGENGNVIKSGLNTDEKGVIFVNHLKPGTYQFIETEAPKGYKLDDTPIPFVIEKGTKDVVKVNAYNEKIVKTTKQNLESDGKDGAVVPKTATPHYNLILIGLGVLVAGFILLLKYRKRKQA